MGLLSACVRRPARWPMGSKPRLNASADADLARSISTSLPPQGIL
jgi:hypothetical protein